MICFSRYFSAAFATVILLGSPAGAQPAGDTNRVTRAQYEAGAITLFEGRDIAGTWDAPGENWTAEGGTLQRTARGGSAWFHRHRVPGMFDLTFDYQADPDTTGGLAYMRDEQEIAIGAASDGMPSGCTALPADGPSWHTVRLRAANGMVEQWVDGRSICKVAAPRATADDTAMFFPRLLDGRGKIQFRNIVVTPILAPGATT